MKFLIIRYRTWRYRKLVRALYDILMNTNKRRIDFGYTETRLVEVGEMALIMLFQKSIVFLKVGNMLNLQKRKKWEMNKDSVE